MIFPVKGRAVMHKRQHFETLFFCRARSPEDIGGRP